MIQVRASRVIDRPIVDVWAYLSNLDNMPSWDPGLVAVEWRRPLTVGSVVVLRDSSPLFRMASRLVPLPRFVVSELEPGRRLGLWASPDRGKSWLHAVYSLDPDDGRTRVTRDFSMHGAGAWKILELALRRRAVTEREGEVANLQRILESQ